MKLKPCPFCGSDLLNTGDTAPHVRMGVECAICGAKHGSVESWNIRPLSEPTEAEVESAIEELGLIKHMHPAAWIRVYKAMIKAQEET